jgi:integrase/recombinase XerD
MKPTRPSDQPPEHGTPHVSTADASALVQNAPDHFSGETSIAASIPAFDGRGHLTPDQLRVRLLEARHAWLSRSPSSKTRENYGRDLSQFLKFVGAGPDEVEALLTIRPTHVAAWRDRLTNQGLCNASILRKMTVLRSLFSYLQTYGYTGANPAHSDFVQAPAVPRDGKTVGLSSTDCRRLLDAPDPETPAGIRDRAILAVLAYSACRVGELARLRARDYRDHSGHKVLEVLGKGGKERRIPLHPEAFEKLNHWLDAAGLSEYPAGPLFRPTATARGQGRDGFREKALTLRSLQAIVKRYARALGLDPAVTVHSLRVTALTTARERGADIIDLQDFAGHSDPRTTLSYIRTRDRLSQSPAYVLRY